jgi:hypothetical protein
VWILKRCNFVALDPLHVRKKVRRDKGYARKKEREKK